MTNDDETRRQMERNFALFRIYAADGQLAGGRLFHFVVVTVALGVVAGIAMLIAIVMAMVNG